MKVYDPDQVTVSFAGIVLQGYGEGEFVRIEDASDGFSTVVGTDGEVSRSKSMDRRATVTFVLMQTSESNDLLSALHNLDRSAPGGAGVGALYIRDRQGTALYRAGKAWIKRTPNVTFDRAATSREWTIECERLDRVDGGN